MIYKWLSSLLWLVNRKLRNFLWTGSCEETKLIRVAWGHCCKPYSQGGLGLKDLGLLNDSLLKKLTWRFMTTESFAFWFLRERYLTQLQKSHGGSMFSDRYRCYLSSYRFFGVGSFSGWAEDRLRRAGFHLASRCSVYGVSNHVFAFEVELLAASIAINFAWKNGWHRIWLDSDSSYVVQLLSSRSEQVPWRIRQAWQRFIYQISKMEYQVSHIFRKGNQVADALSKHVLGLEVDSW
ncbi:hypothetical protein Ddye_016115 [Dipteronia dyeriana]|uniref:RNase H type-1 domain-containing protein n=1 Tax=Dipteronia dyeriana TaxID=168575 RepID=A0AAD9U645_9ROSI|nr:hypothetical protein Ddye_016115 [Dipteronia dyeriana]